MNTQNAQLKELLASFYVNSYFENTGQVEKTPYSFGGNLIKHNMYINMY